MEPELKFSRIFFYTTVTPNSKLKAVPACVNSNAVVSSPLQGIGPRGTRPAVVLQTKVRRNNRDVSMMADSSNNIESGNGKWKNKVDYYN